MSILIHEILATEYLRMKLPLPNLIIYCLAFEAIRKYQRINDYFSPVVLVATVDFISLNVILRVLSNVIGTDLYPFEVDSDFSYKRAATSLLAWTVFEFLFFSLVGRERLIKEFVDIDRNKRFRLVAIGYLYVSSAMIGYLVLMALN